LTIKLTPYTEVEPTSLLAPRSAASIPPGGTTAGYRIQRRRADYPSIFSFQRTCPLLAGVPESNQEIPFLIKNGNFRLFRGIGGPG